MDDESGRDGNERVESALLFPACLFGGFGVVGKGGCLSEGTVAVRRAAAENVNLDKAENLAYRNLLIKIYKPNSVPRPESRQRDVLW